MLRISREQHERLMTELSYSPYAYIPSHKIVNADAKECLTDNELLLIICLVKHYKYYSASESCLIKSFAGHGLDDITFKCTKWSLIHKKLIDRTADNYFFYAPAEIEKNYTAIDAETDAAFAAFDKDTATSLEQPIAKKAPRSAKSTLKPATKIKLETMTTEPKIVNFTPGFFARGSFCYYAPPTHQQSALPILTAAAIKPDPFPSVTIKPDPFEDYTKLRN